MQIYPKSKLFRRLISGIIAVAMIGTNIGGTVLADFTDDSTSAEVSTSDSANVSDVLDTSYGENDVVISDDIAAEQSEQPAISSENEVNSIDEELGGYAEVPDTSDTDANAQTDESDEVPELSPEEQVEMLEEEAPPVEVEADKTVMDSADYIKANINSKYAKADKLEEKDILVIKQTMAIGSLLPDDKKTIDALWLEGNGGYAGAFVNMAAGYVFLYNTDDNSDYYVAYANTQITNDEMYVSDYAFAYNNINGEAINDCIYDAKTGLVYVPKKYQEENKNDAGFANIQVQFLQIVNDYEPTASVNIVVNDSKKGSDFISSGVLKVDANQLVTTIQVSDDENESKYLNSDYMTIYVNNVPTKEAIIDSENGVILLNYSPLLISSVKIDINRGEPDGAMSWIVDNLFGGFKADAASDYGLSDEDWLKWTLGSSTVFDFKNGLPTVGKTYNVAAKNETYVQSPSYIYAAMSNIANPPYLNSDLAIMHSIVNGGSYSVSTDVYGNGIQSGSANSNTNYSWYNVYNPYGNAISNNLATITKNAMKGFAGVEISTSSISFPLLCAHVQAGSLPKAGTVNLKVLSLQQTSSDSSGKTGSMVVAISQPDVNSQAGVGAFRLSYKAPPDKGGFRVYKDFFKANSHTTIQRSFTAAQQTAYRAAARSTVFDVYSECDSSFNLKNKITSIQCVYSDAEKKLYYGLVNGLPLGKDYYIQESTSASGFSWQSGLNDLSTPGNAPIYKVTPTTDNIGKIALHKAFVSDADSKIFSENGASVVPNYPIIPSHKSVVLGKRSKTNYDFESDLIDSEGKKVYDINANANNGVFELFAFGTRKKQDFYACYIDSVTSMVGGSPTGFYDEFSKAVNIITPENVSSLASGVFKIPVYNKNDNIENSISTNFKLIPKHLYQVEIKSNAKVGNTSFEMPVLRDMGAFSSISDGQVRIIDVEKIKLQKEHLMCFLWETHPPLGYASPDDVTRAAVSFEVSEVANSQTGDTKYEVNYGYLTNNNNVYEWHNDVGEPNGDAVNISTFLDYTLLEEPPVLMDLNWYKYNDKPFVKNSPDYYKFKGATFSVTNVANNMSWSVLSGTKYRFNPKIKEDGTYELIDEGTTDDNTVSIVGLPLGTYTIAETSPSEGFDVSDDVITAYGSARDETALYESDGLTLYTRKADVIYRNKKGTLINDASNKAPIFEPEKYGGIAIKKENASKVCDGLLNYSLEGAIYNIVKADDSKPVEELKKSAWSDVVSMITPDSITDKTAFEIVTNKDGWALTGGLDLFSNVAKAAGEQVDLDNDYAVISDESKLELPFGYYYIIERQAPSGFDISYNVSLVRITSFNQVDSTANLPDSERLAVIEQPILDPIDLALVKVDKNGGVTANGNATLEGAEFEFKFYDTTSKPTASDTAVFTATYQTVKDPVDGISKIKLNDKSALKSFVSSNEKTFDDYILSAEDVANHPDVYQRDDAGKFVMPVGWLSVHETKAPSGYEADDNTYYYNFKFREENGKKALKAHDEQGNVIETIQLGNQALDAFVKVEEEAAYGGLKVLKADKDSRTSKRQGTSELWAEYEIKNLCDNPVVINKDNLFDKTINPNLTTSKVKTVSGADALKNVTLSSSVFAAVRTDSVNPNEVVLRVRAAGATEQAVAVSPELNQILPAGNYSISEVKCSPDYNVDEEFKDNKFTISGTETISFTNTLEAVGESDSSSAVGSSVFDANFDSIKREGIKIHKALSVADYGDIDDLSGAEFTLSYVGNKDTNGNQLGSSLYIPDYDVETRDGVPVFDGSVDFSKAVVANRSHLVNVGDDICILVSDKDGNAMTPPKYLPRGLYCIKETKAPDGTNMTSSPTHNFWITREVIEQADAEGYATSVSRVGTDNVRVSVPADFEWEFKNPPIKGNVEIKKVDAYSKDITGQGDSELWAEYAIFNKSVSSINWSNKSIAPNKSEAALWDSWNSTGFDPSKDDVKSQTGYITTITTKGNADNIASCKNLPYGTYEIVEINCSPGYVNAKFDETFKIRSNGEVISYTDDIALTSDDVDWNTIDEGETVKLNFNENEIGKIPVRILKLDADLKKAVPQGDASLAGCELAIFNDSKNPVWVMVDGVATEIKPNDDESFVTVVTDDNGWAMFDGLPIGKYHVKELSAPTGYRLNSDWEQSFVIDASVIGQGELVIGNELEGENKALTEPVKRGKVTVTKVDAESDVPQGDAELWAKFSLINISENPVVVGGTTYDVGSTIGTLTANESNKWTVGFDDLPYGTYELKEVDCSSDYHLNADGTMTSAFDEKFEIHEDGLEKSFTAEDSCENYVVRGSVSIVKFDAITGISAPLGDASLEGAEFTITNESKNPVVIDGKSYAKGDAVAVVTAKKEQSGDSFIVVARTDEILPIGTYSVVETKAPEGYKLNKDWKKQFSIKSNEKHEAINAGLLDYAISVPNDLLDTNGCSEMPIVGGVKLQKWDKELDKSESQGGDKRLEGIVFDIYNRSGNDVLVDGKIYHNDELVKSIESHWNADEKAYTAETADDSLSYGTYEIIEHTEAVNGIKKSNGFYLGDADSVIFEIRDDKVIVDLTDKNKVFKDTPIRGEIKFNKVGSLPENPDETKPLFTAWIIKNNDTGEQHIIRTDKDGNYCSASNKDYVNSEKNDSFIEAILNDESKEYSIEDFEDCGIWFGLGEFDSESVSEAEKGAFTVGSYTMKEIRTDTNFGYTLETVNFSISATDLVDLEDAPYKNALVNDLGEIVDIPINIKTNANDGITSEKIGLAEEEITIIDTVTYENLNTSKTYELQGTLRDKETGEEILDADGNKIMSEKVTFKPESSDGSIDVPFKFSGVDLRGKKVVVFEDLYQDGKRLTTHSDINDDDQTISYPEIKTSGINDKTEDHDAPAVKDVTITDTVTYKGLIPGKEYTIKGILMDATTKDELIDATGKEIRTSLTFTPDEEDGSVDVSYTFDASNLAGHTAVIFETLYYDEFKIAIHADFSDLEQTIYFPDIETTATDGLTGAHSGVTAEKVTLVDTVDYENLLPGKTYTLYGTLYNKETGKALTDEDGNEIKSSAEFTPTEPNGKAVITFTFDSVLVEGKDVVAFERLERNKIELATHTDIEDEGQTVHYPKIRTQAYYADTKLQEGLAKADAVINDTVMYENLEVGRKYTLNGILVDKATGTAIVGENGTPLTASKDFTPTDKNGEVVVKFEFNAADYEGRVFTVFEELLSNYEDNGDVVVATHKNKDDAAQTVSFPKIETELTETDTDYHEVYAGEDVTLTDTVAYSNLIVGKEYTLEGVLMNKKTGEPIVDANGNKVIGTKTFTPTKDNSQIDENNQASGIATIEFKFNAVNLAGTTTVAFETLYRDKIEVAVHTDIDDEQQTVNFPKIATYATDFVTKDHYGVISESAIIIDEVSYDNVTVGKVYSLTGKVMSSNNEVLKDADGNEITATASFTAEGTSGKANVEFRLDTSSLGGKKVVIYETLSDTERILATHKDYDDSKQTIKYPVITTKAVYGDTDSQEGLAAENAVINDTVSYENFQPKTEYILVGTLMNKETNEAVIDKDGNAISNEVRFTPENSNGEIVVPFEFDATDYAGMTFVVFERAYREVNGERVAVTSHEDIADEGQTITFPEIGTELTDDVTDSHEIIADEHVVLSDTVAYHNLVVGREYVMSGKLMNKNTNEPMLDADGNEIVGSTTFTPDKSDGVVTVTFEFNGVNLVGESAVAFEECRHGDIPVAIHTDIDDEDQTVRFPKMQTILHKFESTLEDKTIYQTDEMAITDEVMLDNLTVGNTYRITGYLVDKKTGDKITDADGKTVNAEETIFKATDSSMKETITFKFDGTLVDTYKIVAFDELYALGVDEVISNNESSSDNVDVTESAEETTIIDVESESSTEEVVTGDFTRYALENNVETTDATESSSDSENASDTIESKSSEKGILVADGKKIEDENETMEIIPPEIGTTALGKDTQSHMLNIGKDITIVDAVAYKNLNPGTKYTISGTLMDKETKKPMVDKDNKNITSTVEFTPKEPNGTVNVEFTINTSLLMGKTIVVFENLYIDSKEVAVHADINDENQTVHILKIGTVATGSDGRSKTVDVSKNAVIKDTVQYENLVVGEEYVLTGSVMNRATGKQVGDTVQVKFKPEKSSGTAEVQFTIDTTALSKQTLVCFETLSDKNGKILGEHKDINDDSQSVIVKTTTTVQTGVTNYAGIVAVTAVSAVGLMLSGVGGTMLYRKRKIAKIKKNNQ